VSRRTIDVSEESVSNPSKDELRKKADGWLNREGYPLEMRVARALRDAGFLNVNQAETYFDPVDEKWRDIDVTAAEYHVPNIGGQTPPFNENFAVRLVVECTYTKPDPWIVFPRESNRLAEGYAMAGGRLWSAPARWVPRAIVDGVGTGLPIPKILEFEDPIAYGVVRSGDVRQSGEDPGRTQNSKSRAPAYQKVAQVVSAGEVLRQGDAPMWTLVLPVIVIEGELFKARLLEDGRASIEDTKGVATLLQQRYGAETPNLAVTIVTAEALPSYARATRTNIVEFFKESPDLLTKARKIGNEEAMRSLR
jgi:hypothetical protein